MNQNTLIPIPKIFRSDLTGAPMEKCIMCEKDLLNPAQDYIIEKAIKPFEGLKAYSTVFEYAMCMPCAESMRGKISTQSMQRINQYFMENIDISQRRHLLPEEAQDSITPWLDQCMVTGEDVKEMGECQIYAQCKGDQMIVREFPYMIGSVALDEVMELLSPETKEEFDGLQDELLDTPSEFQDLLQGGPRVFI